MCPTFLVTGDAAPMAREKVTNSGPDFVTFFRAPPGYFTGQFIAFSSIPGPRNRPEKSTKFRSGKVYTFPSYAPHPLSLKRRACLLKTSLSYPFSRQPVTCPTFHRFLVTGKIQRITKNPSRMDTENDLRSSPGSSEDPNCVRRTPESSGGTQCAVCCSLFATDNVQ